MHLSSITIKGFKSFAERTRLVFSPGVSVVVGPNGCGKSNITDAVLWALGEQSPLAVRGQSMQDMIFAGGEQQSARRYAEVEVVLDNSDGAEGSRRAASSRRSRSSGGWSAMATGEYRLNGARCRLVDVIEVLADANLGREMHSVISQGRVDEIVHSKPRDRRLLVEEAAGLGKHRKRRRRAQLKLERTQENLDRALDVEREARSRLRPLKRQAQAADIQARLEREAGELRARLLADELRGHSSELEGAEREAAKARDARERIEAEQAKVNRRRTEIEERLAQRDRERTQVWGRLTALRAAHERLSVRAEALSLRRGELTEELERHRAALGALADEAPAGGEGTDDDPVGSGLERISSALETAGQALERARAADSVSARATGGGASPRGIRARRAWRTAGRGAPGSTPAGLSGEPRPGGDRASGARSTSCSRRRPRRGPAVGERAAGLERAHARPARHRRRDGAAPRLLRGGGGAPGQVARDGRLGDREPRSGQPTCATGVTRRRRSWSESPPGSVARSSLRARR